MLEGAASPEAAPAPAPGEEAPEAPLASEPEELSLHGPWGHAGQ